MNEDDLALQFNSSYAKNNCSGLIGCGRDLKLVVNYGNNNELFTSGVYSNPGSSKYPAEWILSSPRNSAGTCSVTYDGMDNSTSFVVNGLGGIDITANGSAQYFQVVAYSDTVTSFSIYIYSLGGGYCYLEDIQVTPDYYGGDVVYNIPFAYLHNNCNLNKVGSMEVIFHYDEALDISVKAFQTVH